MPPVPRFLASAVRLRAQRRALRRLLAAAAPTPWGRSRGLDPRMPLEEFASLPAAGAEEVAPFVERIVAGEREAMTVPGALALVRTSGATGPPRLLPITAAHRRDLLAFTRRVLVGELRSRRHSLPRIGRWLLVTASTEMRAVGGLPAGYLAGVFQDALRQAWPATALPDPDIAAAEAREERLERLVAVARGARVDVLFGVPADLVALLERLTDLVGRPAGEVWPTLEAVYWTGTHLGPARARIERLVGRPLAFHEVYGGAEGAYAADFRGQDRLVLVPDRLVFAFEPLCGGRRRLLHELEAEPVGARFEMLVTNAAGLVQARVGDVVETAGGVPAGIAVVGRTDECLSLAGEGLVPHEAQAALGAVAAAGGLAVVDWIVAPAPDPGPPGHLWVLEAEGQVGPRLDHDLDATLRRVAPAYARARAAGRLGPPEVRLVPRGAFAAYRAAAWPPAGPSKARPFARSWAEAMARPGLGPLLAALPGRRSERW
jgi:hypothetical protein